MVGKRAPLEERFWSKVDKRGPDDCWPWTAHHNGVGYGMIWSPKHERKILAHRCSFELHHGALAPDACVLHRCDNPKCVNPAHLFLGTHKDNYDDMVTKGRRVIAPWCGRLPFPANQNPPTPARGDDHWTRQRPQDVQRGSTNGFSKLTEADVRAIFSMRLRGQKTEHIAQHFGLHPSTVGDIINGVHWRHMLGTKGCPTLEQLLAVKTSKAPNKLTTEQAREIKQRIKAGEPIKPLAREFGIAFQTVSDIKRGKSWAFL